MTTRDLVLSALFAAVIIAMGLMPPITLGFIPVPITLQTLGVMLAGAILGPRRGAAATALVVVLVVAGFPVLAGGRGGLGVVFGPTGGFLIGWIPGAFVTGLVVQRFARPRRWEAREFLLVFAGCVLGGIGAVYVVGIPWLAVSAGLSLRHAALACSTFVAGDLVKAAIVTILARGVGRVYPIALR